MRYTMISIGSMGDVKPYLLLGKELMNRGHQVKIAAFSAFEEMVTQEGFAFFPLAGSVEEFMAEIMKPGVNGFTYLKHVKAALEPTLHELLQDMQNACADAQAVISTFFGTAVNSIAEKLQIPCIQTHYFPIDYNSSMPISSAPI